jgi:integrase/recombinase XerD
MNRHPLIDQFLAWQQARHMAPKTIKRRRISLASFEAFIAPADVTTVHWTAVDDWLGQWPSPRTRHAYRCDVNVFYAWAVKRDLIERNPVDRTDPVKVPKSLPRPIPADMIPSIIASCERNDLRRALALAAYAGLRNAEIVALHRTDITLDTIVVRQGKGCKDRAIPIIDALHPHLVDLPHGRVVPMTSDWLGTLVHRHLRRCGIAATIHCARHSFGTEAAEAFGGNLRPVALLLGHASVVTTECYALLTPDVGPMRTMYQRRAA